MTNDTNRIEAFSDGVFSIAATLLVLELKPPAAGLSFWQGIIQQWPGYASFLLSFLFIGIMWINHHRLFSHIKHSDDALMAANLLLLARRCLDTLSNIAVGAVHRHRADSRRRDLLQRLLRSARAAVQPAAFYLPQTRPGRPQLRWSAGYHMAIHVWPRALCVVSDCDFLECPAQPGDQRGPGALLPCIARPEREGSRRSPPVTTRLSEAGRCPQVRL